MVPCYVFWQSTQLGEFCFLHSDKFLERLAPLLPRQLSGVDFLVSPPHWGCPSWRCERSNAIPTQLPLKRFPSQKIPSVMAGLIFFWAEVQGHLHHLFVIYNEREGKTAYTYIQEVAHAFWLAECTSHSQHQTHVGLKITHSCNTRVSSKICHVS